VADGTGPLSPHWSRPRSSTASNHRRGSCFVQAQRQRLPVFSRIASDARAAREIECRTRPPTSLWALKISFPTLPPILSHTLLHSSFLTGCTTGRIRAKSTVGCSVKSSQRRTISTAGHRRLYTHFGRRPLHTVSTCRRHSRSTGIRQHLVDPLVSRSQA